MPKQFVRGKNRISVLGLTRTRTIWLSLMMVLLIASVTRLRAQLAGEGAIQGRVTDPTGAIIPSAVVTATNVATDIKTVRSSTSSGVYVLSPLPPGEYTVSVSAPGFAKSVQEHIIVDATQSVGLDVKLTIGTQTESITVTDAPPALETTNATLGQTMENKTYSALPLEVNGGPRDPTAFAGLMPGVASGGPSGSFNGAGGPAGRVNEIYVDGMPVTAINMQGNAGVVSQAISVDAVDQFQVITSGASAQYTGMGVSNFNIKSGTNKFHGSAADFLRNTMFDSWGFFAKAATTNSLVNGVSTTVPAPKPGEHQNELALTVGGPIRIPHLYDGRDKLFFFVSFDKYHQTYGVNPSFYTIPTLLEQQGNFTELNYKVYDPTTYQTCTAANNGTPCTYPFQSMVNGVLTNNVIPQSELSSQSQYMQKFMPAPTVPGTQNNLLTGTPGGTNNWELTARIDYQLTPNQRFTVLSNSGVKSYIGLDGGGLPPPYTNARIVKSLTANGILEHNYVISPHLVNNLKYAYIRSWAPALDPWMNISQYEAGTAVGIGNLPPGQAQLTFPNVSFSGFADTPTNWPTSADNSYDQYVDTYEIMDNLQWTKGQHNLTFGLLYQWLDQNDGTETPTGPLPLGYNSVNTAGYTAGKITNTTTGNSYASFMVGAVNSSSMSVQPFTQLGARFKAISPNVEDDWRVNSKLTLNLGLRWDLFTPYHEVLDRWSFLNMTEINPATGTPGALQFAGNGTYSCHCSTPVNMYWGNVGPRVGLAYSVNDKTVLRAAFSTVYSHSGGVGGNGGANYGTGQTGLTGSASFPSSGQSGAIPAFYLNNSAQFQTMGISNTSLPAFTPTNNVTPFRDPTKNAGNYINSSGVAVTPQGVSYPDPYLSGRAPYSENWNIGIERVIFRKTVLSVNYSASQSHFITGGDRGIIRDELDPKYEVLGNLLKQLPTGVDSKTGQTYLQEAQAIVPGIALPYANFGSTSGTINAMLLPHPQYSAISDTWGNVANSNYNSLQLTLKQQTSRGVTFTLNYTYSKEIDDTGCCRSHYDIPAFAITDGIARKQTTLDRQEAGAPQALHAFGVWELPFGKGHIGSESRLVNVFAGGWSLSGIFSYSSGSPINVGASGCLVIGEGCNPSYTPGYTKSPRMNGKWGQGITPLTASTTPFLDATAFFVPNATYQMGNVNAPSDKLFGIGNYDLDASIRRTFKIWDKVNFIVAADAFNATNHVQFTIGGTSINKVVNGTGPGGNAIGTNAGSNFGTISGQGNSARDWQFSGHLNF
jgi:hypothetical protein